MTHIKDINTYVNEMAKSLEDKLWFKIFLDMPIFNHNTVIYDWGCGSGIVLNTLAKLYPNMQFIGVDINADMVDIANMYKSTNNVNFYLCPPEIKDKQIILVMSSVFHEIMAYDNWEIYYKDVIERIKPDYIFFRDMAVNLSAMRYPFIEDITKVKNCHKVWDILDEDIECRNLYYVGDNRHYIFSQRDLIHFLLKYRYAANWFREADENYLPIYFEDIPSYFKDYNIVYSKHYILPFIKNTIKYDFDIDLKDNTHCNIIFKLK